MGLICYAGTALLLHSDRPTYKMDSPERIKFWAWPLAHHLPPSNPTAQNQPVTVKIKGTGNNWLMATKNEQKQGPQIGRNKQINRAMNESGSSTLSIKTQSGMGQCIHLDYTQVITSPALLLWGRAQRAHHYHPPEKKKQKVEKIKLKGFNIYS